jgi:RNA polymerase sigma-70 factor (ECF subfamily)
MRRAQHGDGAAWQVLYSRCLPAVWRYVYALSRDHSTSEEVVSETMLALVRGIHGLDPDTCHLHGWLRRVARNKLSDIGRHAARQRRLIEDAGNDPRRQRRDCDPAGPLETGETRRRVLEVLEQLDDCQRDALECKYLDGLSVREIAERFDQSEKAAESLLYRARREFRRLYNQFERQEMSPSSIESQITNSLTPNFLTPDP